MSTDVGYNPTIKELPSSERPRERLLHMGRCPVHAELLAIILRTVSRMRMWSGWRSGSWQALAIWPAWPGQHSRADVREGLGPAKVAQLKAALELGRRMLIQSPDERPQVRSPADAANLVMSEMALLEQENLRVMLLDTKNRVLDTPTIYVGSLNTSLIRVGELFREAIRANCASLIVLHNHPSGDPTPSPEDVAVTRQIVEAGKLLDVEVLDHLIIGQQRFVSLKERGLGFG